MNKIYKPKLISAAFICFGQQRFKCYIKVNSKNIMAYIPCSSSLSKYFIGEDFNNSHCYIYKNKKGGYTLFAIKLHNTTFIVDLKIINKLFGKFINKKDLFYEKYIGKYRADIIDKTKNIVYEIKSVLSNKASIIYPDKNCTRIYKQLEQLGTLKVNKIKMVFLILNLNITEIIFSQKFLDLLKKADKKLNIEFYYCFLENKETNFKKILIKSNLEKMYVS